MKKALLILFLLGSLNIKAAVGIGHLTPFFGTFQNELDGGTEGFFSINPYISLNERFRIFGSRHHFAPEIGYALPSSSTDLADASSRSMVFILWNFAWEYLPRIHVKYGIGTFWTRISTEGGAIETPNGNSTVTAFLPEDSQTSYNSTINLGLEFYFSPKLAGKVEAYAWEPLNSDKRRFNIAIGANYYFGSLLTSGGNL